MPYTKTPWVANVTPVTAVSMNNIEAGIATAPGTELAYTEFTADVTFSAATAAAANTIVTASAVTFDGVTVVWVEFQADRVEAPNTVGLSAIVDLWDGSTDLGVLGSIIGTTTSGSTGTPFNRSRRLTPSAGSHTFSVRGWLNGSGSGTVRAGTGGAGANLPGHIRIVRM